MDSADHVIVLKGTVGLLAGQGVRLTPGDVITIGRSRSCEVSTRRSRTFLRATEEEQRRILEDKDFLKVSRRHLELRYVRPDRVELRDLSQNGTFVDGRRVISTSIDPRKNGGVEIRMATSETFWLEKA